MSDDFNFDFSGDNTANYGIADLLNTAGGNLNGNYEYVTQTPATWNEIDNTTPAQTSSIQQNSDSNDGWSFSDVFGGLTSAVGSVANVAGSLTKAYTQIENAQLAQKQAELQQTVAKGAISNGAKAMEYQQQAQDSVAKLQAATQVAQAQQQYLKASGQSQIDWKTLIALGALGLGAIKLLGSK